MFATAEQEVGIRVSVRIRPLNQRELDAEQTIGWEYSDTALLEKTAKVLARNSLNFHTNHRSSCPFQGDKTYTFDNVFDPQANNTLVYEKVAKTIVRQAMSGYNGTVFTCEPAGDFLLACRELTLFALAAWQTGRLGRGRLIP